LFALAHLFVCLFVLFIFLFVCLFHMVRELAGACLQQIARITHIKSATDAYACGFIIAHEQTNTKVL
jgi:ABC-type sulfate transport system permease component